MENLGQQKEFSDIVVSENSIKIRKLGDDRTIGEILFLRRSVPVEHYLFSRLSVERSEQGKGFASRLLQEFERLCIERHLPALLYDLISDDNNPEAAGMYSKRKGWSEVPGMYERIGNRAFVFNLQEGQTPSDFIY